MMDVFSKQSGAVEEESALDFEPYFKCNNLIAGGFLKTQSLTQTAITFLLLNWPPKKGSYPT